MAEWGYGNTGVDLALYFVAYTAGVANKKMGMGRRQFPSKIKFRNITYMAEWGYGNTGVDLALAYLHILLT